MTINFPHLLLLGIVTSSLHWLVARSKIAEPLWRRATGYLDALLRCASCSGFWLGGAAGFWIHPVDGLSRPGTVLAASLLALFVTPVFESVLLWGLEHSALVQEGSTEWHPVGGPQDLAANIKARLGSDLGEGTVNVVMSHVHEALGLPPT